jgi:hypothetical protein
MSSDFDKAAGTGVQVRAEAHGHTDRKFSVTIRNLAGHSLHEQVRGRDRVADVTAEAVRQFVARHQLAAGSYALTLPRLGSSANLDPTGTLADVGIREGDVLVLVSRDPQVDG